MRPMTLSLMSLVCASGLAQAQTPSSTTEPFAAGAPLSMTPNARTYGGFRFAESISYDAERDLYVVPSAGIAQDVIPNDGYVSLINPDGTAHTLKWIGVNRNGLTLNHPLGSHIANGRLYLADIDTIRWFDMQTGTPLGSVQVSGASRFNDLEAADDGTVYATQTGNANAESWRIYRITPDGEAKIIVQGAPLNLPNGIAFDADGNLVVVHIGSNDVHTFSPDGTLLKTEQAVDDGNDGIVIVADGTKYVSSVRKGTISRIRPGQAAEVIASGLPSPASMGYDPKRNRLLLPANDWNAITIVELAIAEPGSTAP